MTLEIANSWASSFGLALDPLFGADEALEIDRHHVLLDGGAGSFALSISDEPLWHDSDPAAWAWSSNLPHHVTLTPDRVAVWRWDQPKPEILSRQSVDRHRPEFYKYLVADRVRSNRRVVDHLLDSFRKMRSLLVDASIDDRLSVDAFLSFLSKTLQREEHLNPIFISEGEDVLPRLSKSGMESLYRDTIGADQHSNTLRLIPELAIRHAGSEIFQEAHFELLRAPQLDMFGFVGPAQSNAVTRGGAHFTPPALARSISEQTLLEVENLDRRRDLTILDPACGSGAFLYEGLRALRRRGFKGDVRLVGRDISGAAVAMARFVLERASLDWPGPGRLTLDLAAQDSLSGGLPKAEVILMNPPFVSWSALSAQQRDQMRQVLGERLASRGDLSMAFITAAMERVSEGGAIGAILPSGLLTMQGAEAWRSDLVERGDLRFIASLGDYGLFSYAVVQVAAIVLAKPALRDKQQVIQALVTANSSEATGNAFRELRKSSGELAATGDEQDWRLFPIPSKTFRSRQTWRLAPPEMEAMVERVLTAGAVRVGELFHVRQGVRTGANEAFVITGDDLRKLPASERQYFRLAVMNDAVEGGLLRDHFYVFYPYDDKGLLLKSEADLRRSVPRYAEKYLYPARSKLAARANLQRTGSDEWWTLSWSRHSWALANRPRIVSKYFGGVGGFAVDDAAKYVVVQGFAWLPRWQDAGKTDDADVNFDLDILHAFSAVFNSSYFASLLEIYSPHVAGGQFDLSPRYVDEIPIPNLPTQLFDRHLGEAVGRLSVLARDPLPADRDWRVAVDRLVAALYGSDLPRAG